MRPGRPAVGAGWRIYGVEDTGQDIEARRAVLKLEHRDLDAAIDALRAAPAVDQLRIARLKKRKLRLKDEIALLDDWSVPDIIA